MPISTLSCCIIGSLLSASIGISLLQLHRHLLSKKYKLKCSDDSVSVLRSAEVDKAVNKELIIKAIDDTKTVNDLGKKLNSLKTKNLQAIARDERDRFPRLVDAICNLKVFPDSENRNVFCQKIILLNTIFQSLIAGLDDLPNIDDREIINREIEEINRILHD